MESVKLPKEHQWGAMLGVLQTDTDKFVAALLRIVDELRSGMAECRAKCIERGIDYESDLEYQRYFKLFSMFGGLYSIIWGSNGLITSLVCELLSGLGESGKCEEESGIKQ